MKVIILAGGLGTRLSEKTHDRPKPMVEIGGKPILWHIMNLYSSYGFNEFIIALGYRGDVIKDYFINFFTLNNDISVDLSNGEIEVHEKNLTDWKVHLIDTGLHTQTGGRLKRLKKWIGDDPFMMTYGDGLSNIDISALLQFHFNHEKLATVSGVRPPARFGSLISEGSLVKHFSEKPQSGEGWINGGFFVLEPEVLNYIENDDTSWELNSLANLATNKQLLSYKHEGFWMPMDTLREQKQLETLWQSGRAPWIIKDQKNAKQKLLSLIENSPRQYESVLGK